MKYCNQLLLMDESTFCTEDRCWKIIYNPSENLGKVEPMGCDPRSYYKGLRKMFKRWAIGRICKKAAAEFYYYGRGFEEFNLALFFIFHRKPEELTREELERLQWIWICAVLDGLSIQHQWWLKDIEKGDVSRMDEYLDFLRRMIRLSPENLKESLKNA